jgi:ribosome-associated toxin RatA of RatAB toxin-antitoxin module
MPTVTKSVIVPHGVERMFELVDRVEDYPDFLPWCAASSLIERTRESRGRASTSTTMA